MTTAYDRYGALNVGKEGVKNEAKNKESLDLKSGPENELTNTDVSKKRVQRANEAKAPAMETKTIKTPPLTLHQEEIIPSVAGPSVWEPGNTLLRTPCPRGRRHRQLPLHKQQTNNIGKRNGSHQKQPDDVMRTT